MIEVLEEGHSFAMKDVESAIYSICIGDGNKGWVVENREVRVVLKIEERVYVDEMLVIIAMVPTLDNAVMQMANSSDVSCLFSVIRWTDCERNEENCIVVVHRICFKD